VIVGPAIAASVSGEEAASRPRLAGSLPGRLFARLLDSVDASVLEAGAKGELLVAHARLGVALVLVLLQALPTWPGRTRAVALPASLAALAYAAAAQWAARTRYRPSLALATAAIDVTLVSAILVGYGVWVDPHLLANSWAAFELYFLTLALATLRFHGLVCALTGALALLQYGSIVLWTLPLQASDAQSVGPFPFGRYDLNVQLCRLVLLGAATLVSLLAVLQARALRQHLIDSLARRQAEERAREERTRREREELSRELHDAVAQLLFGATLVAQSVGPAYRRDPAEGERQVERLLDLSRRTLAELRALMGPTPATTEGPPDDSPTAPIKAVRLPPAP